MLFAHHLLWSVTVRILALYKWLQQGFRQQLHTLEMWVLVLDFMLQVLEALNVFDPADVDNAVTALDEEVCALIGHL